MNNQQQPIYFLQPKNGLSLLPTKVLFSKAVNKEYRAQASIFGKAPWDSVCADRDNYCWDSEENEVKPEWEQAHARHGLEGGGLAYPDLEHLSGLFPANGSLTLKEVVLRQRHANAAAFLHSLKSIGAGTASRRPLPASALRRVMSSFDAAGSMVTYRTALCCWTRNSLQQDTEKQCTSTTTDA